MNGLYAAKAWYTRRLTIFIRWAVKHEVSPDVFTAVGVLFAVLVPVAFVINAPLLVLLGLAGRLAGANLDGAVARARGVSRPFGFLLNEIGDRLSDFIIMTGPVIVAYQTGNITTVTWTAAALAAATIPTIISVSAAAAGGTRMNGGPFGKTERALAIFIMSILITVGVNEVTVLTWGSVLIILGSVSTGIVRTLAAHRQLKDSQ